MNYFVACSEIVLMLGSPFIFFPLFHLLEMLLLVTYNLQMAYVFMKLNIHKNQLKSNKVHIKNNFIEIKSLHSFLFQIDVLMIMTMKKHVKAGLKIQMGKDISLY